MGKNQEPEALEKKSEAGASKNFAGSPALLYDHGIVTYLIPILGTFINILIGRHLASGEAGRERKRRKLGEKILKGRKIEMWAKKGKWEAKKKIILSSRDCRLNNLTVG